jgi:hypothetical protein
MKTQSVELKLYLEGVPVNFISINIQERSGSAPVAVVNIPPKPEMGRLMAKTLAHVFYKMRPPQVEVEDYYLIFEGELTTTNFGRSQSGAGCQLTFVGLTNNWKNTYKGIVDFSMDSLMTGHFLLIGASAEVSQSEKYQVHEEKPKRTKDTANFLISKFPGTNITARLQQSIEIFTKDDLGKKPEKALDRTFKALVNDLSTSNPYYGMIHDILKIPERMYAFNNAKALATLRGEVVSEVILRSLEHLSSVVDGSQIVATLLNKIEYEYLEPAAPTKDEKGHPRSIMFAPQTMFFMPLRCNTIFPDQILQSGYTHDYSNEITRLVTSTPPISLQASSSVSAFTMQPKFIAPQRDFFEMEYEGQKLPAVGMILEEKLRGINPYMHTFNDAQRSYASFWNTYAKKNHKDNITDEKAAYRTFFDHFRTSQLGNYVQAINMWQYLKRKYSVRTFTVTTTYTPHRLVGFPGLVIDKELPAIVGKIVSINSNLDANGSGTSSIQFQAPRSHKEYDFSTNEDPWTTGVFDEMVDEWPGTPFWIDETYDPYEIGNTLKPAVMSVSTGKKDPSDKVTIDFHAGKLPIDKSNISHTNVNIIAKSIYNLKKKYNIYQEKHPFIEKETRRTLMTETDFWKFLVGKDTVNYNKDDHYKSFKKDITYNAVERKLIYKRKPFVQERRQKVLEAK